MSDFNYLPYLIGFATILVIVAVGMSMMSMMIRQGFTNYNLAQPGKFPQSQTDVLLQDTYQRINSNGISNNTSDDMWWHYPSFKSGSYDQITNNIRYSNNPDLGNCLPGSICGSLYHEKKTGNNYVKPLPPINPNCGTRVGYFSSIENTFFPYRSLMQNILY
jgi:hypothetical protein